jgi:hypothetical protein
MSNNDGGDPYNERRHPRYTEAVSAECEAVQRGNTNFRGIGKPEDL